jgi:hypothetical protein
MLSAQGQEVNERQGMMTESWASSDDGYGMRRHGQEEAAEKVNILGTASRCDASAPLRMKTGSWRRRHG